MSWRNYYLLSVSKFEQNAAMDIMLDAEVSYSENQFLTAQCPIDYQCSGKLFIRIMYDRCFKKEMAILQTRKAIESTSVSEVKVREEV